ncbi:rubredoxin [Chloroflexota bacterium]
MGSHTIFIGNLVGTDVIKKGELMTYAYYHQVKWNATLKIISSYIEQKKEVAKMPKYKCTVCGYIYDPALGDPGGGIKPGTPFEKIPNDWACPVCGVTKDEFEKVD